jgi:uncharacterized protein (UPF0333 family)
MPMSNGRVYAIVCLALLLAAIAGATVLMVGGVGEAGAGNSAVGRGGYVKAAYRNPTNAQQLIIVFHSTYAGTVEVVVNVSGRTGSVTSSVVPGDNTIIVPLSAPVALTAVDIQVSVNRVVP